MTIRLLIAEDHQWVREGLRAVFHNTDIEVAGEATNGDEAITQALENTFDVMLLDIKMPGCDGFEVLKRAKAENPNLRVVVYSQHDRPDFRERARQLSASGYLVKTANKNELIAAIQKVNQGERLWDEAAPKVK